MDDKVFEQALDNLILDKDLAYAVALHAAIRNRDRLGVAALLSIGADVNWMNSAGESALYLCSEFDSRNGKDICADLILARPECQPSLPNNFGVTPIQNALRAERPVTARLISARLNQTTPHR
jgi:ankyrin repeat protein